MGSTGRCSAASKRRSRPARLPPGADPQILAMILVANHYELSARARAGCSRAELRVLAAKALATVRKIAGLTSGS